MLIIIKGMTLASKLVNNTNAITQGNANLTSAVTQGISANTSALVTGNKQIADSITTNVAGFSTAIEALGANMIQSIDTLRKALISDDEVLNTVVPNSYGTVKANEPEGFVGSRIKYPPDYNLRIANDKKIPLVLLLHGGGGNILGTMSQFDEVADRMGGIVLELQALRSKHGNSTWIPNESDNSYESPLAKIQAIRNAVIDVMNSHPIDLARVYAIGYSEGAFLMYELAIFCSDIFASVVPINGYNVVHYNPGAYDLTTQKQNGIHPVNVLALIGSIDDTVFAEFKNQDGERRGSIVGAEQFAKEFHENPTSVESVILPYKIAIGFTPPYTLEKENIEFVWDKIEHKRKLFEIPAVDISGNPVRRLNEDGSVTQLNQVVDIVVGTGAGHGIYPRTNINKMGQAGTKQFSYAFEESITLTSLKCYQNIAAWLNEHPKLTPPESVPSKQLLPLNTVLTQLLPGDELYPNYLSEEHDRELGYPVGRYAFNFPQTETGFSQDYNFIYDITDTSAIPDASSTLFEHLSNSKIIKSVNDKLYIYSYFWGYHMLIRVIFNMDSRLPESVTWGWAPGPFQADLDDALVPQPMAWVQSFVGSYLTIA